LDTFIARKKSVKYESRDSHDKHQIYGELLVHARGLPSQPQHAPEPKLDPFPPERAAQVLRIGRTSLYRYLKEDGNDQNVIARAKAAGQ
jgi:hypothetical protein